MILGPCPCQGCGQLLYWTGTRWRTAGQARHGCPRCGALMKSGDRCARKAGHGHEHRSAYALENARIASSGLARARAKKYNRGGGVSAEPNRLTAATAVVLLTPGDGRRFASGSKTDAT